MTGPEPAVVTGLGVVDPAGWGSSEARIAAAHPAPRPIEVDRSAGFHRTGGSRLALLVDTSRQPEWMSPLEARRLSAVSRFAVCAAKMAIEDSGTDPSEIGDETAVVCATAYGASDMSERILRQSFLEGPDAVSPALFTESVANAAAAHVALSCGARGPNITITQFQAGPAIALQRSLYLLRAGRSSRVLVCATDEMTPLLHAILDRFGALARPDDSGHEEARPFDLARNGWMASEGAVVAVLETESRAKARNAHVIARIAAAGSAFDPASPRSGWPREPEPLAASLRTFLARHSLLPRDVDIVVSGASGHSGGDRLEGAVLRRAWAGAELPPVLAPAGASGAHSGALLCHGILAASGASFAATHGFHEPDPDLEIIPHRGGPLPPAGNVLMTVCATGGSAGWAVLGPGDHGR